MQSTCANDLIASAIILAFEVVDKVDDVRSVAECFLLIFLFVLALTGVGWSSVWWNLSHFLHMSIEVQDRRSWLLARQFSQYRCLSTMSCLSLTVIFRNWRQNLRA